MPKFEGGTNPPNRDDGNMIGNERFEAARIQRENMREIENRKRMLLELKEDHKLVESELHRLASEYDKDFWTIGEGIDDRIYESETEIEEAEEKGSVPIDIKRLKGEIAQAKLDAKRYGEIFDEWETLGSLIAYSEQRLFNLMGETAFHEYLLALGYDPASVAEAMPYFKESRDEPAWDYDERESDADGPNEEEDEDDEVN